MKVVEKLMAAITYITQPIDTRNHATISPLQAVN